MFVLAVVVERVVLRPLVNQPDIILFMATIGITLVLVGLGETIFGGENKVMIARELGIPAVVGAGDATHEIRDGQEVTVSCVEGDVGYVYEGKLPYSSERVDLAGNISKRYSGTGVRIPHHTGACPKSAVHRMPTRTSPPNDASWVRSSLRLKPASCRPTWWG
mgnify:CR=1 FL=1